MSYNLTINKIQNRLSNRVVVDLNRIMNMMTCMENVKTSGLVIHTASFPWFYVNFSS